MAFVSGELMINSDEVDLKRICIEHVEYEYLYAAFIIQTARAL